MKNMNSRINLITKTTEFAMNVTLNYIDEGDLVIDATAGNGYDTLVLAKAVGEKGKVFAFDIQKEALKNTEKLLQEHHLQDRAAFINDSHENIQQYVDGLCKPSAVIFNLGYLPMGDKTITTKCHSSVLAVKAAIDTIKIGGIVTLVLYSGHTEGREEKRTLLKMLKELPGKEFHVAYVSMTNQVNNPPEIVWVTRKK